MSDALPPHRLAELDAFLLELNRAAAEVILPLYRAEHGLTNKAGPDSSGKMGMFDPVTEADRGAEAAIRRLIAERFPEHGVIGEEYGEDRPDAEFVWVLDPIDGTRSFISGIPLWTTLIALRHQGRPVLGSIGQPYIGELYVGSQAQGSRLIRGGAATPLRTRPCPRLTDATVCATDPDAYMNGAEIGAWRQVRAAARLVRLGQDSYLFALVAAGLVDLLVESGLKVWDYEAAIPLIEGAGGVVTDWRGRPFAAARPRGVPTQVVAAGDRACLDEALVALKRSAG